MTRTFLVRGLLAGALAGLIGFGVAFVLGEPPLDAAIALEASAEVEPGAADSAAPEDEPLVSRDLQSTAGLLTATVGYGLGVGGLFGLVCAVAHGRLGRMRPRASSALLAGACFVAMVLVPFLKYPANPPAVGNPSTINERTSLYLILIVVSALLAWVSLVVGRALAPRLGTWDAALVGGAVYLGSVLVAAMVLPEVDEVSDTFPASLLYDFRVASLVTQVAIWTAMGLVFGWLSERARRESAPLGVPSTGVEPQREQV